MKTWLIITLIVLGSFFLIGVLVGLTSNPSSSSTTNSILTTEDSNSQSAISEEERYPISQSSPNYESIQILSHEQTYSEYGNLIITGIAKNTESRKLSYAEIDVKFYDNDGNVIGNSFDNINNLGAGETWKFEVMYFGTDDYNVGSYDISVGTTW